MQLIAGYRHDLLPLRPCMLDAPIDAVIVLLSVKCFVGF